jgi:hypothetical protein
MENDEMTNDAAVAWLVTNGGESCEPWLVWELSEVKALPSSCIADPLYSATTVAELRARVAELEGLLSDTVCNLRRMANDEFADCEQVRLEHVVNRIEHKLARTSP